MELEATSRELPVVAVPLSAGEVEARLPELAEGMTGLESLLLFDPSKLRKRLDIEESEGESKDQREMRRYSDGTESVRAAQRTSRRGYGRWIEGAGEIEAVCLVSSS